MTMNQQAHIGHRRLAAIFSADVAGYTRLMNFDEAGTLRLLGSHRDVTDRLIVQHGGRVANTADDSILPNSRAPSMPSNARSASRKELPRSTTRYRRSDAFAFASACMSAKQWSKAGICLVMR
jgi:adenylate cyclase